MKRNDNIFGKLEFDYGWFGESTIKYEDKIYDICLSVHGDEDETFQEEQYEAYTKFKEKLSDEFILEILNAVLEYYKKRRKELGYEKEQSEDYILIETTEELLKHLEFSGIEVLYSKDHERRIGLTFECDWDEENGVGIYFVNEEVKEIGYQDVAI